METLIITRHDCLGYVCIEGRGRRNEDDGEERDQEERRTEKRDTFLLLVFSFLVLIFFL